MIDWDEDEIQEALDNAEIRTVLAPANMKMSFSAAYWEKSDRITESPIALIVTHIPPVTITFQVPPPEDWEIFLQDTERKTILRQGDLSAVIVWTPTWPEEVTDDYIKVVFEGTQC